MTYGKLKPEPPALRSVDEIRAELDQVNGDLVSLRREAIERSQQATEARRMILEKQAIVASLDVALRAAQAASWRTASEEPAPAVELRESYAFTAYNRRGQCLVRELRDEMTTADALLHAMGLALSAGPVCRVLIYRLKSGPYRQEFVCAVDNRAAPGGLTNPCGRGEEIDS